jgi:hypothetical protein
MVVSAVDGGRGIQISRNSSSGQAILSLFQSGVREYQVLLDGTSGDFRIRDDSAAANRILISSNGNVTINTPSSGNAFTVHGASGSVSVRAGIFTQTNNPRVEFTSNESSVTTDMNFTYSSGATIPGTISVNGNVAISFTTTGQCRFNNAPTTANAANAYLDGNDNNALSRSTSSIRYKKDIIDITEQEANVVLQLRPITYKSKAERDDPTKRHFGLIAEEVALVEPKLVHYIEDENGNEIPDGVQYERIVVLLLKKLQQTEARLTELESRVLN